MEAPTTYSLRLERQIAAPPETVFRAWTEAGTIVKWFAPAPDMGCVVHTVEPRRGGRLELDMRSADGSVHELRCTFHEYHPNDRLALRWRWASNPAAGESLVTVSLSPEGTGTRLVIVHEGFPTEAVRESHQKGWTGCLGRLPAAL